MQQAGASGRRARHALSRGLKTTAAAADRVRRAPEGVVVLLYHRVGGGSALAVDLPIAVFDAQMEALAASGRAVTIDRALDLLTGRPAAGVAPNPVVVT